MKRQAALAAFAAALFAGPPTFAGDGRIELSQLNFASPPYVISAPGSYVFTENVTVTNTGVNGIAVEADNVTIDLNGFTFAGPGANSGSGIYQDWGWSYRGLSVCNGKIAHWKAPPGLFGRGGVTIGRSSVVSEVHAMSNTVGISVLEGGLVRNCTADGNSVVGILANDGKAIIQNCTARGNGSTGIYGGPGSLVSGCMAINNTRGIHGGWGSCIRECVSGENSNNGIEIISQTSVIGCKVGFNTGNGIYAWGVKGNLIDNECHDNGYNGDGAGICVSGTTGARIEGNCVHDNDRGIQITGTGNLVIRNTASGNGTNWEIAADNKVGPIVAAPVSGAISGDTGGAGVGSADPWANFTY